MATPMAATVPLAHIPSSVVFHPSTTGAIMSKSFQAIQMKYVTLTTSTLQLSTHDRFQHKGYKVACNKSLQIYAESNGMRGGGASDFFAGFVLGGVIFGALGYLFAPQMSKTSSNDDRGGEVLSNKLQKFFDDDEGLEKTRRNLNEKIAQLNAAIDDVSAQLRADDGFSITDGGKSELESAT